MVRLVETRSPSISPATLRGRWGRLAPALLAALLLASAAARAQVGSPDPTFGGDGVVVTDLDLVDIGWDVLARVDGTLLVVGETQGSTSASRQALLLEYGSSGALLQSRTYFVQPGCNAPETLYAIREEANGDLLVGGYAQFGCSGQHERDFWLLRLNPDGSLALAFDRPIFYGNFDQIRDLAIQPDGKIVAAGIAASSVTPSDWNFGVARYNADGTLDASGFGSGGEVALDLFGDSDFPFGIAVQPDGRIVVAGYATQGGQRDIALVRLLPDGMLDSTFGSGGIVTTDIEGFSDYANDVAVLPGGAIVVSGTRIDDDGVTADPVIVRYLGDGTLDPSFGVGGIAIVDFGFRPAVGSKLVVQYDGKIVVTGTARTGGDDSTRDVAVARVLPDGSPDLSFDGDGARIVAAVAAEEDVGASIALQPFDGDLVVAGYSLEPTGSGPLYDVVMVRLIGDAGRLIFADGFESGDTSEWSSTTPFRARP